MGLFHFLHEAVTDAFDQSFGQTDATTLVSLIDKHAPALKNLFNVPARSAASKQAVDAGNVTHGDAQVRLDAAAKNEILALSEFWDMDELKTAEVYLNAQDKRSVYNCSGARAALLEFHSEREAQVEIVRCILGGVQQPEHMSAHVVRPFSDFVTNLAKSSFASKTVAALQQLAKRTAKLSQASCAGALKQLWQDELEHVQREQKLLVVLLIELSTLCGMTGDVTVQIMSALADADADAANRPLVPLLLVALLTCLRMGEDRSSPTSSQGSQLATDAAFVKNFHAALSKMATDTSGLFGVVRIAWAIFLANVADDQQAVLSELAGGKSTQSLVNDTSLKGVQAGAFPWLIKYVMPATRSYASDPNALSADNISYPTWMQDNDSTALLSGTANNSPYGAHFDDDFLRPLYTELEHLTLQFFSDASANIRMMKEQDEKALLDVKLRRMQAQKQPHRHLSSGPSASIMSPGPASASEPYRHYEAFLLFVSLLFADRPDAGLVFWESKSNRPYYFLKWAVDMAHNRTRGIFYDMLASLATGPRCAEHAYQFLLPANGTTTDAAARTGPIDWSRIFGAIRHYIDQIQQSLQRPLGAATPTDILHPDDANLINALLRLLKQVVQYSLVARQAIIENREYEALRVLFDFLTCSVPLRTKAVLLDCIAAFARDDGLLVSDAIALSIWQYLEDIQIVPARGLHTALTNTMAGAAARSATNPGGLSRDLEDLESRNQTYPETLAFLRMISSLLHVHGLGSTDQSSLSPQASSIPDNLGAGYRTPGVQPYVDFVIDQVFLRAGARGYLVSSERWQVYAACLQILEKCLLTFDLSSLMTQQASGSSNDAQALPMAIDTAAGFGGSGIASSTTPSARDKASADYEVLTRHPGFDILCRMLSGHRLLDGLLYIVNAAKVCVQSGDSIRHLGEFRLSVCLALRILYRCLKLQKAFLEVLVPELREQNFNRPLPAGLTYLDQYLVLRKDSLSDIAYLILPINDAPDDEVAILSVKLLTYLSVSPPFCANVANGGSLNPLVAILQSSEESNAIIAGYVDCLRVQLPSDDVSAFSPPSSVEHWTDETVARVAESHNVNSELSDTYLQHFSVQGSVRMAILELLLRNVGPKRLVPTVAHLLLGYDLTRPVSKMEFVPDAKASMTSCFQVIVSLLLDELGQHSVRSQGSFRTQYPVLAEHCYNLIFRLVSDRYTSAPTLSYLRNVQNFFERQAKDMPFVFNGSVVGASDNMDDDSLAHHTVSYIYQHAWLLRSIAVELHVSKIQRTVVSTLLQSLFGSISVTISSVDKQMRSTSSVSKMVRAATSLLTLSAGNAPPEAGSLADSSYYGIDYDQFMQSDSRGCVVYDIRAIAEALFAQQRHLARENRLSEQGVAGLKRDMRLILLDLLRQNQLRQLYTAKYSFFCAWKEAIGIVLLDCFDSIDSASQQTFVNELLLCIVPHLGDASLSVELKEVLAQCTVQLMHKMRTIAASLGQDMSSGDIVFAIDQSHLILRHLLNAIQQSETSEVVRGNLYAALLTYLLATSRQTSYKPMRDLAASVFNPSMSTFNPSASVFRATTADATVAGSSGVMTGVDVGNLAILRGEGGERLLDIVCRDSTSSAGPWNTIALALLDQLVELVSRERDNWVLQYSVRANYIGQWIAQLRGLNDDLVKTVTVADFENMQPYYMYDAIMTLLIRIAQRHAGATRLLENRVMSALAEMEFMLHTPDSTQMHMSAVGEPSLADKYAHMLSITIKLPTVMMSALQRQNATAVERLSQFVNINALTLNHVLADKTSPITLSSLRQLRDVTALLLYATNSSTQGEARGSSSSTTHINMLLLFSKYAFQDNWYKSLQAVTDEERRLQSKRLPGFEYASKDLFVEQAQSVVFEICRNVLGYCRVVTDPSYHAAGAIVRPTFLWSLAAARDNDYFQRPSAGNPPTLGLLVNHLKMHLSRWRELSSRFTDLQKKKENVASMPSSELSTFLDGKMGDSDRSAQAARAGVVIQQQLMALLRDSSTSLTIIEQSLVLLWRHLDMYFDQQQQQSMQPLPAGRGQSRAGTADRNSGASFGGGARITAPTAEELEVLKNDSSTIIPTLVKRISDLDVRPELVGGDKVEARKSFLLMLSRKIASLAGKVQQQADF
ncbi:hypothetical protein RI367_005886 [Sorochytrium milnesiophthora]